MKARPGWRERTYVDRFFCGATEELGEKNESRLSRAASEPSEPNEEERHKQSYSYSVTYQACCWFAVAFSVLMILRNLIRRQSRWYSLRSKGNALTGRTPSSVLSTPALGVSRGRCFSSTGKVQSEAWCFASIVWSNSWKWSSSTAAARQVDTVPITYIEADGTEKEVQAQVGQNLLDVAHDNNIELEGKRHCPQFLSWTRFGYQAHFLLIFVTGACGGELACSTCHLIFEKSVYDTLPEKKDDEDDMLDLAFEVTET